MLSTREVLIVSHDVLKEYIDVNEAIENPKGINLDNI